jgi:hypothetical protein
VAGGGRVLLQGGDGGMWMRVAWLSWRGEEGFERSRPLVIESDGCDSVDGTPGRTVAFGQSCDCPSSITLLSC